ncbi:MAG: cyclic nucleotide-binding domain-containing protein [Paracoccaceae bacterium]
MNWTDALDISGPARAALNALPQQMVKRGKVLFRAGEPAQGFVVVLSGRIKVFLTGPSGR